MTLEDFLALTAESDKQYEFIFGEMYEMPSPKGLHQVLARRIFTVLWATISAHQRGELFFAPFDVYLTPQNIVQPDIFFVASDNPDCRLGEDDYYHGAPNLCIEILSPATAQKDKTVKLSLYEQAGVAEYWIVDADEQIISVYRRDGDKFALMGAYGVGDRFDSPLFPDFSLAVAAIFEA